MRKLTLALVFLLALSSSSYAETRPDEKPGATVISPEETLTPAIEEELTKALEAQDRSLSGGVSSHPTDGPAKHSGTRSGERIGRDQ